PPLLCTLSLHDALPICSWFGVDGIGLVPAISLAVVIGVGVLATPSFRQRIYSARSVRDIRRSFLFTGVLYLGFSVIPAIIGMAADRKSTRLNSSHVSIS